jgi:glycine dehydrogenase
MTTPMTTPATQLPDDLFVHRHVGPSLDEIRRMLAMLGAESLDELSDQTVPESIRLGAPLALPPPRGERETIERLRALAERNRVARSFIGLGYHGTITPPVIQRNVLENPGWYTAYTPYQAEISQGRLEVLFHFQTMIAELTALPIAGASLLDEATAAAEAMHMAWALAGEGKRAFFVDRDCHPQTIAVVRTRALPLGIEVCEGRAQEADWGNPNLFGVLVQYPATTGAVRDYRTVAEAARRGGALLIAAADPLALTLLAPPGEWGADVAVGSTQRLGTPMSYGGPHAAFIACRAELKRQMPGRIVGLSRDAAGRPAYRLALQTREQHIRREKATSNICTAQVLPAVVATMYAVYHGPAGLKAIARRVNRMTASLAEGLRALGHDLGSEPSFDTLRVALTPDRQARISAAAAERCINLRLYDDGALGIALDETVTALDLQYLLEVFGEGRSTTFDLEGVIAKPPGDLPQPLRRTSPFLTQEAFNAYRAEHEMLRYLHRLEWRDLSLTTSMIPLGSCTMKLNGTSEMLPITWPEFADLHPFAPADQAAGYRELFAQLESRLAEITGLAAVSLQPNSGAQGEYTGLMVIRAWHAGRGGPRRNVCLIPVSAHGTNPASATMAGMSVVTVACDAHGNIDVADLRAKAATHRDRLAAFMVTYPSTHGVFEEAIREICAIVHEAGGQVYMDGANMNAQVGLTRPAEIGADVVHLNLHKTFCIPHGGGGPGMGPIAVAEHLAPYLPGHPLAGSAGVSPAVGRDSIPTSGIDAPEGTGVVSGRSPDLRIGPVSAAPWGSAGILPISWVYIALMGAQWLRRASQVAILNANYMAERLQTHYPVLYRGARGRVAHEFILDLRPLKKDSGIEAEDVAKRLMDYGFHAPTLSFPVPGTLMIEPTESESKAELDRFCDALIAIRAEIRAVAEGRADRVDNVLKNAPHTAQAVTADEWTHRYTRREAAWPAPWLDNHKYWPAVARVDNAYGDRNLVCACPPPTAYDSDAGQ